MTTEQLTIEQRLTNLELGQDHIESEVMSDSHMLDRLETQTATLVEGHIATMTSLVEIQSTLARIEERQTSLERRAADLARTSNGRNGQTIR